MEYSAELIELARAAKTPEELQSLAEEQQIVLSEEQAWEYFGKLNRTGALSDEELAQAAGGKRWRPKGTFSRYVICPKCGKKMYCGEGKISTPRDNFHVRWNALEEHAQGSGHGLIASYLMAQAVWDDIDRTGERS